MAVVDVIRRRARTVTIERPGTVTRTDGYAAEGTPTTPRISMHSQPLSPDEVRDLPPGQDAMRWRNVWSEDEIRLRDKIPIEGRVYTVKSVDPWTLDGHFYHARATITEDTVS